MEEKNERGKFKEKLKLTGKIIGELMSIVFHTKKGRALLEEQKIREVIDGVEVVHTNKYLVTPQGVPIEKLEMYDAAGNRFYSNVSTERAEEVVAKLKEEGKEAVIGTPGPGLNFKTGRITRVRDAGNLVGVYIQHQGKEELVDKIRSEVKTTEEMAEEIETDENNEVKSKVVETQGKSEIE